MAATSTDRYLCKACRQLVPSTFQSLNVQIQELLSSNSEQTDGIVCCCCLGLLQNDSQAWKDIVDVLRRELLVCDYTASECSLGIEYPAAIVLRCSYLGIDERVFKNTLRDLIDTKFLRPVWHKPHAGSHPPLVVTVDIRHSASERQLDTWLPRFGVLSASKKTRRSKRGEPKFGHSQVQRALNTERIRQYLAANADTLFFNTHFSSAAVEDDETDAKVDGIEEEDSSAEEQQGNGTESASGFRASTQCAHSSVFVAGRYRKLQRGISQTEWTVRGKRLTEHSVAEIVAPLIAEAFRSRGDPGGVKWNFLAAGREDADVRMLGSDGRPFIIEVLNPTLTRFSETSTTAEELEAAINRQYPELVQVADIQQVSLEQRNAFTRDDNEVRKSYACEIWLSAPISEEILERIHSTTNLSIRQETPIRVLHRRAPGFRMKMVFEMRAERIDEHHLRLDITTEGGTYIKEFVHGDHGRTTPSLGVLLQCQADILTLDVTDVHVPFPPRVRR